MKTLSRRHVLRGAGLALTLPWLESLEPRRARGQAAAPMLRFVAITFPLGTADYWSPKSAGAGAAWQLSPILEPLATVKNKVSVLGQIDQTAYGPTSIVPMGNGPLTASFLTAAKCAATGQTLNGISVDQRIAQTLSGQRGPSSLQLGLATMDSAAGDTAGPYGRSISWMDARTPLYKLVDPQLVFDTIVAGGQAPDPMVAAHWATSRSVLDYVMGNAVSLERQLGRSDRERMDRFLTSVRDVEQRAAMLGRCTAVARPTLSVSVGNTPNNYNRDDHASVMIDLLVMALSCDFTRVATFMLDDADSTFVYDFLDKRSFSATGSQATTDKVAISLSDAATASGTDDAWATINWWFVSKLASLCQKMAAIEDGATTTLLDNSVVWFGSGQHQGEETSTNLPVLYVGSGGGRLKVDQAFAFAPSQSLSNVYLTFLRAFGIGDPTFGDSTGPTLALET